MNAWIALYMAWALVVGFGLILIWALDRRHT